MADLPTNPNNREEQYLASISGQDVETPACPYSRKEAYLEAIDERVESLQEELETLENNPDVADIVDTYADLEAYDTSTLTDKDIIRVLNDETHDGNSTYYRYSTATGQFTYIGTTKQYTNFVGTDGTTAGQAGLVPAPATTDAGKFLKADGTWDTAGSSSIVELTAGTDYNYPFSSATKTSFHLASLDNGIYKLNCATNDTSLRIAMSGTEINFATGGNPVYAIVGFVHNTNGYRMVTVFGVQEGNGIICFRQATDSNSSYSTASNSSRETVITAGEVLDNLTQSYTRRPLSANQGRILKDLIDSLVIKNAGAPTTSTTGTKGQLLEDTTNGKLYQCTAVSGSTYTWEEVGGGSGPTVVQTTGTSTTDVMSQNATTGMIYADPSTKQRVQIGSGASTTAVYGVAIGTNSAATATNGRAIAIGEYARASGGYSMSFGSGSVTGASSVGFGVIWNKTLSERGVFDVSTGAINTGYNNSGYRLLTGLYDPQSAHDAATKGYVDGTTETATIATTDWVALTDFGPYDYSATITATATISSSTGVVELLNDQPALFGTYGFAIGAVSGQSVTIYSIGQPDASVSLKLNIRNL